MSSLYVVASGAAYGSTTIRVISTLVFETGPDQPGFFTTRAPMLEAEMNPAEVP